MTTIFAVVILALFAAFEGLVRVGGEARSLRGGPADRGTVRRLGASFGISFAAVVLSPLANLTHIGVMPEPIAWFGVVLMVASLPAGFWAVRGLGASYTRTLRVREGHVLVTTGLYRFVRHPGYAAGIARWIGAGLATSNLWVALFIFLITAAAYHARIRAEESMLLAEFGDEFREYARRTWRLVPPLY